MISEAEKNLLVLIDERKVASTDQLIANKMDMNVLATLLREEMIEGRCFVDCTYYTLTPKGQWQLDLWKRTYPNSDEPVT